MKRREFLQQTGLALATLGISESSLWQLSDRALSAMAQPTARKLALLVGIDRYPISERLQLEGSVTDVRLQEDLLIHRFGFSTRDVLTLTDKDATREGIESAFLNHLIAQASPEDVVVFHFSGYGRCINSGESVNQLQSTLVPVNGDRSNSNDGAVNDLFSSTLQLLLKSLPTDRVLTVLDTSYLGTSDRQVGNLRSRSYPSNTGSNNEAAIVSRELTPEAIARQEQLMADLNTDREQLRIQRRFGRLPGTLICAARPIQRQLEQGGQLLPSQLTAEPGFEAQWNGFSAGVLTYGLTQHWWSASPQTALYVSFATAANNARQTSGDREHPHLIGETTEKTSATLSQFNLAANTAAQGVVEEISDDGKTVHLSLGGLPPDVLAEYQDRSLFTPVTSDSEDYLQLRSVEGLAGKAVRLRPHLLAESAIAKGDLVRESVRCLSHGVRLIVGIGEDLERIERVDATSAFSAIANVSTVVLGESAPGVNCIFDKVHSQPTADTDGTSATSGKVRCSYGLFSAGLNGIPKTVGETGEAVKTAVRRLSPLLETLRAQKLLRLTSNEESSNLAVRATLEQLAPRQQTLGEQQSAGLSNSPSRLPVTPLQVPMGSHIAYRLQNLGDRPLYAILFSFDRSGVFKMFCPSHATLSPKGVVAPDLEEESSAYLSEGYPQVTVPPGESLLLPDAIAPVEWTTCCGQGLAETQIILSTAPFAETAKALQLMELSSSTKGLAGKVKNPGATARAVLEDLHQASSPDIAAEWIKPDSYMLSTKAWCSFRFIYQVV
ncbi:caspase family protein [Roseofilum casamattae]|uniref:Caspase family protein n=1 Tax=Roseofilum casamattae BLCC-M143 TaxID=3022442 RepID=A0ABT7C109_9CYAN|nr:caspase family protein [Roseofilum casamattae]MDJ1185124.1 caspase family protein [Roseofilum casamattae BLCC-M143]